MLRADFSGTGGKALAVEDVIERGDQVGRGVDERAVEIENNDAGRGHGALAIGPGAIVQVGAKGREALHSRPKPARRGCSCPENDANRPAKRDEAGRHRGYGRTQTAGGGARAGACPRRHEARARHRFDRQAFRRPARRKGPRRDEGRGRADLGGDPRPGRAVRHCADHARRDRPARPHDRRRRRGRSARSISSRAAAGRCCGKRSWQRI